MSFHLYASAAAIRAADRAGRLSRNDSPLDGHVDVYGGPTRAGSAEGLLRHSTPRTWPERFAAARACFAYSLYIRTILELRIACSLYGLRVTLGGARASDKSWLRSQQGALARFVAGFWRERFITDNVIAFWLAGGSAPILLPVDRCDYQVVLDTQRVTYRPGWSQEDLDLLRRRNPDLHARYLKEGQQLVLGEDAGESVRVWTADPAATGYALPRLLTALKLCIGGEGMEVGEELLGNLSRNPMRQHKLGHDIRSGPLAGQPRNFANKKRILEVKKFFNGLSGAAEFASNFDHEIAYHQVPAALFDGRKWTTLSNRASWWGGPMGLLLSGLPLQTSAALLRLLQTETEADRQQTTPWLEEVMTAGFSAPRPLRLAYSSQCFLDTRIWAEMLKFSVGQGAVALETLNDETSRDHDEQRARKRSEAKERDAWLPMWDPSHGKRPTAADTGGRPAGTADPPPTSA